MSTTLIRNIRRIQGLTKLEFVKRVKSAIGSDNLMQTMNFIEQAEALMQMHVDSNFVPHLRNCFTFEIVTEDEVKQKEVWETRRQKIKAASEWLETLPEEQKEFVYLLAATPSAS